VKIGGLPLKRLGGVREEELEFAHWCQLRAEAFPKSTRSACAFAFDQALAAHLACPVPALPSP
jgi:hypothetical protein